MKKETLICDCCGKEFTQGKPDGVFSNLNVYMGEYNIKIDITKAGMVTDLCSRCRNMIVSQALSQDDPFFGLILESDDAATEARKRKERQCCLICGT